MGFMQQLGRALMLPTIVLPLAAVLLFLGTLPWDMIHAQSFGHVLSLAGQTIFGYLPYVFAVGVALGLTEAAAIAGMSALLGYFLFIELSRNMLGDFQPGVIGGILLGLMAALIHNRFKTIKLPEYIQFFGGQRIVPIFTGIGAIAFAYATSWIGPKVVAGLVSFGEVLIGLGGFGTFLYGVMSRLLVPTGLHHILNNVFHFQVGTYETSTGVVVHGDLPRFFEGDPTAGIYMSGLYPILMFALPAIAIAIIRESREDLKAGIKLTFLTAALASFLTGVTEPIEFAFLFVAPYLFVVHAILTGLSMWLATALDIHHGYSFSAGAIDFLLITICRIMRFGLFRSAFFMESCIMFCSAGQSASSASRLRDAKKVRNLKSGQATSRIALRSSCRRLEERIISKTSTPASRGFVLHLSTSVCWISERSGIWGRLALSGLGAAMCKLFSALIPN
jgi:glucose PTS system EIICBA or EIICB component